MPGTLLRHFKKRNLQASSPESSCSVAISLEASPAIKCEKIKALLDAGKVSMVDSELKYIQEIALYSQGERLKTQLTEAIHDSNLLESLISNFGFLSSNGRSMVSLLTISLFHESQNKSKYSPQRYFCDHPSLVDAMVEALGDSETSSQAAAVVAELAKHKQLYRYMLEGSIFRLLDICADTAPDAALDVLSSLLSPGPLMSALLFDHAKEFSKRMDCLLRSQSKNVRSVANKILDSLSRYRENRQYFEGYAPRIGYVMAQEPGRVLTASQERKDENSEGAKFEPLDTEPNWSKDLELDELDGLNELVEIVLMLSPRDQMFVKQAIEYANEPQGGIQEPNKTAQDTLDEPDEVPEFQPEEPEHQYDKVPSQPTEKSPQSLYLQSAELVPELPIRNLIREVLAPLQPFLGHVQQIMAAGIIDSMASLCTS